MVPRVSFVVRNHNYGRYLAQAIDSLLAQTFRAIELIVIDDRSTDGSHEVLRRFAGDERVRVVLHGRNQGHIRTANEGLTLARGELIGVFDADDFCLRRDAVARQVAVMDAHPRVGFVYAAQTYVDERGEPFRAVEPWAEDYVRDGFVEFAHLALRNYVAVSGTLVRRAAHDRVGGYDLGLPHAADWALWLRIAGRFQVAYIAESLYAYRIHSGNMSVAAHSPHRANGEIVTAVQMGFDALPPDAPAALKAMRRTAIQQVLLATHWGDRSLGRVRRSWLGLIDAAVRSPSLLATRTLYGAAARTLLLTGLGHRRYQRLANWRGARPMRGVAAPTLHARQ